MRFADSDARQLDDQEAQETSGAEEPDPRGEERAGEPPTKPAVRRNAFQPVRDQACDLLSATLALVSRRPYGIDVARRKGGSSIVFDDRFRAVEAGGGQVCCRERHV